MRDQMDKFQKEHLAGLKADGWKRHEVAAAQAGWEYVRDMTCTNDGYDIRRWPGGSGSDEAYDLAASTITEKPWKSNQQEAAADCIYSGIRAALKAVRQLNDKGTVREGTGEVGASEGTADSST